MKPPKKKIPITHVKDEEGTMWPSKTKHAPSLHTAIKPHPRNPYPLFSQAAINPARVSRAARKAIKEADKKRKK